MVASETNGCTCGEEMREKCKVMSCVISSIDRRGLVPVIGTFLMCGELVPGMDIVHLRIATELSFVVHVSTS